MPLLENLGRSDYLSNFELQHIEIDRFPKETFLSFWFAMVRLAILKNLLERN